MFDIYKKTMLSAVLVLLHSANLNASENNTYNLPQAIEFALTNNPNLQIMQDRVAQAEAQLGIALASFYPSIKTSLSYEHTDHPSRAFGMIIGQRRLNFSPNTDFNHPGGTDNYRPEVTARYSLFRGGQDYYNTKAAELGIETATLEKSAKRNQLIQIVSSTFFAYLASTEVDKVAMRSIDAISSELMQSKVQYEAGAILKSDVLSLQVQLAEAQNTKIKTANAIALSKTGLRHLLGITANLAFNINTANHWDLPQENRTFEQLLRLANEQRPEVLSAKKYIEIAQQKLYVARGAYLPTADAYVSYGSDSKNLDFSSNRDNVTAGVMVELDVFSGFRDSHKIKKAEHQLAISKKAAIQTQLSIENEVETAYLKLQEALARIKASSASIVAADEALRMVTEQRKAGMVTVTRYIESEVARDQSHSTNIAARFDALRAETELRKAVGDSDIPHN